MLELLPGDIIVHVLSNTMLLYLYRILQLCNDNYQTDYEYSLADLKLNEQP